MRLGHVTMPARSKFSLHRRSAHEVIGALPHGGGRRRASRRARRRLMYIGADAPRCRRFLLPTTVTDRADAWWSRRGRCHMIVIDVQCEHGHRFEGWFASAGEFERQRGSGLVSCPTCGSDHVARRPSAAYLRPSRPGTADAAGSRPSAEMLAAQLAASLRAMAAAAHDVGEHFPQEARKVHAGESEHRSIRGRASRDEVEALIDEGIPILPVPPAKDDLH